MAIDHQPVKKALRQKVLTILSATTKLLIQKNHANI